MPRMWQAETIALLRSMMRTGPEDQVNKTDLHIIFRRLNHLGYTDLLPAILTNIPCFFLLHIPVPSFGTRLVHLDHRNSSFKSRKLAMEGGMVSGLLQRMAKVTLKPARLFIYVQAVSFAASSLRIAGL